MENTIPVTIADIISVGPYPETWVSEGWRSVYPVISGILKKKWKNTSKEDIIDLISKENLLKELGGTLVNKTWKIFGKNLFIF